jgi:hypothetical protein
MASSHDGREAVLVVGAGEYMATRLISALASHSMYRPIPLVDGTAHAAWTDLEVRHCNAAKSAELTHAFGGVGPGRELRRRQAGDDPRHDKGSLRCGATQPTRRIAHISSNHSHARGTQPVLLAETLIERQA